MHAREKFIADWKAGSLSFAELCRRHGVSRKTGYKWVARHGAEGAAGLVDRSRRPLNSPLKMDPSMEEKIVSLRLKHPVWGSRKIRKLLVRDEGVAEADAPATSTVTNALRRHGLLACPAREPAAVTRFERSAPNDLWQMDFKGHFAMAGGARCHPLTVLDDHSRYNLVLRACGTERREEVRRHLIAAFERFGLPRQILCDHGSPWGTGPGAEPSATGGVTELCYWLVTLGVEMIHGRPRHPQTQGKEERFHRTLDVEILSRTTVWKDLEHCQREFDPWSRIYNEVRPHEELEMAVPGDLYRPSPRPYPARPREVESYYLADDELRKVRSKGEITFGNRTYSIGSGLIGQTVALRGGASGTLDVYFCWKKLGVIDPATATKDKGYQNRLLPP